MLPVAVARPVDVLSRFFGVLLVVHLGLLGFYEFVTFKYEVHSDSAVKVLLANEILETGEFFPRDWVYANGDLYVFFCHTLALPLVPLFGPGFFTHALVGLIISLSLLFFTALLLRELAMPRWQQLATLALLASGISTLFAENLYGQATYGFIIMMNVALVGAALRFVRTFGGPAKFGRRLLWLIGLLSLVISWNNPKRSAIMLTAPLLLACLSSLASQMDHQPWSLARLRRVPELWVALVHVVGFFIGGLFSFLVLNGPVNSVDTAGAATWLGADPIWRNGVHAILGAVAQLGGLPAPGYSVVSGWGLYEALRMGLGAWLLWGALSAVKALLTSTSAPMRFVANFTATSGALSVFFFVFTNVPDPSNPMASARYLLPTLFMGLLLLPTRMTERPADGGKVSLITLGAISATALMGFMTLTLPGYGSTGRTWAEAKSRGESRFELVAFLEKEGLQYGYGSYWNAGAITLLSDGRVKVRQIQTEGLLTPAHLHSSTRWFRASQWSGETFLLFTQAELTRINRPLLDSRLGAPARTLSVGNYRVLVYSKNLAGLPGWADLIEGTQSFAVTPTTPHSIGTYQPGAPGEGALCAAKGSTGELLFGPFIWLSSGRYRVSFDLAAEGPAALGTLQVTARQSSVVLATQAVEPGPRGLHVLEFEVPYEEKAVEFRVLSNGTGTISVFGTSIERQAR